MRNLVHQELVHRQVKVDGSRTADAPGSNDKSRVVTANVAMTKEKRPDRRSAVDRVASKPRHWAEEEDRLLRAAVLHYGNKHWKKIAERVPGRNHTQCLQRWSKVLAPGLKKGQWSSSEDATLVSLAKQQLAMCKDPNNPEQKKKLNWGMISKQITGRTAKQCRERWVNNLNPDIRKGGWTPEEDKKILELFELFPKKWAMISKNLEGRTENAVKIRYKSLTRNLNNAKVKKTYPLSPNQHNIGPVPGQPGPPQPSKPLEVYPKTQQNAYPKVHPHSHASSLQPLLPVNPQNAAPDAEGWRQGFNDQNGFDAGYGEEAFGNDLDDFFSPAILNMDNTQRGYGSSSVPRERYGEDDGASKYSENVGLQGEKYKKGELPVPPQRHVQFREPQPGREGPNRNYIQRLDSLITSFDDMNSRGEPEPGPSPPRRGQGAVPGRGMGPSGNRVSQSAFGYYRNQVEELEQKSSNKKRKPRNSNFNLLRKAISGEALDFEVGDSVVHEVRGQGKVLEFDLNNRRGKPYKVCFANGETHEYSIAQVREKLKKCNISQAQAPGQAQAQGQTQGSVLPFSTPFGGDNTGVSVSVGEASGSGAAAAPSQRAVASFSEKQDYSVASPFGSNNRFGVAPNNESWITNKPNTMSDPAPSKFLSEQSLNNFELQQLIELDDSDFDALYSQQPVKF